MGERSSSPVPPWLEGLEKLREKRAQGRLGHESGAGAPCRKCQQKCPGLDLHFWRKICKVCKCSKEEHDYVEEDTYSWVQFHLLGNSKAGKPSKIILSKLQKEVQLDWVPLGAQQDVQSYLEQLPEAELPISGSAGAQNRLQRLQRQLPAHDVDPSLCHDLSAEEERSLQEYVAGVRRSVIGQGCIALPDRRPLEMPPVLETRMEPTTVLPGVVRDLEQLQLGSSSNNNNSNNSNNSNNNNNNNDNNSKETVCAGCSGGFSGAQLAVSVERNSTWWHLECFCCAACRQPLADLMYFLDPASGALYCGRDYAELQNPRCAACDELIFMPEYCLAENVSYHVKHFCCYVCDEPLAGRKYLLDDAGRPTCLHCYDGGRCCLCHGPIGAEEEAVRLDESRWHRDCFHCQVCRKDLAGGRFMLRQQAVFCSPDCYSLHVAQVQ